jgi:hypothetical protein
MTHANSRSVRVVAGTLISAIGAMALADPVTGLTTFTANTPARAGEVNGNFTSVKTAVDDNFQRITTLQTQVTTLQAQLTALQARLDDPQVQGLLAIAPHVSLHTIDNNPVVIFNGVNVQILNGRSNTYTRNGRGNLILGYNEDRFGSVFECSIGYVEATATVLRTEAACTAAGGTWGLIHRGGSHNLVIGARHNYSASGAIVAGEQNSVTDQATSVTGGSDNHAVGFATSVTGGGSNWAYSIASAVSGGFENQTFGIISSISGGWRNRTGSEYASVSGGSLNQANSASASVSGGTSGAANGVNSSISGGNGNVAAGLASHVSGGFTNRAAGRNSSVLGGVSQVATPDNVTIPALP